MRRRTRKIVCAVTTPADLVTRGNVLLDQAGPPKEAAKEVADLITDYAWILDRVETLRGLGVRVDVRMSVEWDVTTSR